MATIISSQPTISPADALWALYQSQTKQVRKAFRSRIMAEEGLTSSKASAMRAFERHIPTQERKKACELVEAIRKGVNDVNNAVVKQTHVGRKAEDFLTELESN